VDAPERIVLGSRGSDLALAQAKMVEQALRHAWPDLEVATEIIRTSGDEGTGTAPVVDRKAGRKGMFTREIEKQLLVRQIDLAVHSAKDLPSEEREELEICAVLARANTEDVLLTKSGLGLTSLARGATIATGSVRRHCQLRAQRPDLQIVDLRGNVPTRLRKLRENEAWSGIILARAGLERLGLEIVGRALRLSMIKRNQTLQPNESGQPERPPYNFDFAPEILSTEDFVPAGGQGVIALQIRREDNSLRQILALLNDAATLTALRAEREFLRLLDGDCDSPVGVHAVVDAGQIELRAQIFVAQETAPKVDTINGPSDDPDAVASALMSKLYGD
jgi:hydroxymethylbilane synthase